MVDDITIVHISAVVFASLLVFDVVVNSICVLNRKHLAGLIADRRANLHHRKATTIAEHNTASPLIIKSVVAALFVMVGAAEYFTAEPDCPVIKAVPAHISGNHIMRKVVKEFLDVNTKYIASCTVIDEIGPHVPFELIYSHVLPKALSTCVVIVNQVRLDFLP